MNIGRAGRGTGSTGSQERWVDKHGGYLTTAMEAAIEVCASRGHQASPVCGACLQEQFDKLRPTH
jgi:hypothetical protein